MKVLPDECVPIDFRHHVTGHDVFTAVYMGWTGVGNGRLLALAAGDGFDAVVTTDGNVAFQINPANIPSPSSSRRSGRTTLPTCSPSSRNCMPR